MSSGSSLPLASHPGLLSMSPQQQQELTTQFLAFLQLQQQPPPAVEANTSPSPPPSNPTTSSPMAVNNHTATPVSLSTDSTSNCNDNLSSIPPPASPPSNGGDLEEDFGNTRFALNKAMGVDPTNRVAVQARRKTVIDFCLEFNQTLDKPYREWTPKSWRLLLNVVATEFHQRYGWTRETCDKVMKCICSDTARNRRGQAKRDQLRASQSGDASLPIVPQPRIAVPIKKKPPPLRKPAKKTSERALQSSLPTPSRPSFPGIASPQPSVHLSILSPEAMSLSNISNAGPSSSHTTDSHMSPCSEQIIPPQETSHSAPHSPHIIQLIIWKAGMVFWDRGQTFEAFSVLMNIHLPIRDMDTEMWIGKCNDWREWKPIIFESNYLSAMGSYATHMHIKMVSSSWIEIEDEDHVEDLSGFIGLHFIREKASVDSQSDLQEADQISRESSLSPPPNDNFMVSNLQEENGQPVLAENLDGRVTSSHKPSTLDDVRSPNTTLLSEKSIGKRKQHVEMAPILTAPSTKKRKCHPPRMAASSQLVKGVNGGLIDSSQVSELADTLHQSSIPPDATATSESGSKDTSSAMNTNVRRSTRARKRSSK